MKNKILTGVAIILLIVCSFNIVFAATTSELNAKKNELKNKTNSTKEKLNEVKDEKKDATTELETINKSISDLANEISKLQLQVDELNSSINEKQNEITKKANEIKDKEELLKKRLVAMYKNGGISYLDVLLSSANYIDIMVSYDAVKEITKADTDLINQITEQKETIEKDKKELEVKKAEVDSVKAQKESKNTELTALKKTKQAKVNQLSEDEKKLQSEIDSYNAAMNQVNQQLAEAVRQAQQIINKSTGGSGTNGLKFDGSFVWPCNNKTVTSRMKWRWGRWHKGIDIGADFENVYASASGIFIGPIYNPGGYGTYVVVVHGNNYVTLYGHLSNGSLIKSGSYVNQGQVIAKSGNTGNGVTHLHFEIRKASGLSDFFGNNNWLDPLDYLPGGYRITD